MCSRRLILEAKDCIATWSLGMAISRGGVRRRDVYDATMFSGRHVCLALCVLFRRSSLWSDSSKCKTVMSKVEALVRATQPSLNDAELASILSNHAKTATDDVNELINQDNMGLIAESWTRATRRI